jgi:hypothetical protein
MTCDPQTRALIEAHIRKHGVTRCPTVVLESDFATIPPADVPIVRAHGEALRALETARDHQSRQNAHARLRGAQAKAATLSALRSHHG